MTLFGPNLVDIEGKSTLSLLIDEVCVCLNLNKLVSLGAYRSSIPSTCSRLRASCSGHSTTITTMRSALPSSQLSVSLLP